MRVFSLCAIVAEPHPGVGGSTEHTIATPRAGDLWGNAPPNQVAYLRNTAVLSEPGVFVSALQNIMGGRDGAAGGGTISGIRERAPASNRRGKDQHTRKAMARTVS